MDSLPNIVLPSLTNTNNASSAAAGTTNAGIPSSRLTTTPSTPTSHFTKATTSSTTPTKNGAARISTNFSAAATTASSSSAPIIPNDPTPTLLRSLTNNDTIISSSSATVTDIRGFNGSVNNDILQTPRIPSMPSFSAATTSSSAATASSTTNESAAPVIPPPTTPIPSAPTTPTPLITSGLNLTSTPSTSTISSAPSPTSLDLLLTQVDTFIKAAAIAAFKKFGTNVSVVSSKFSLNPRHNNINDFIFMNKEAPKFLLVPFLHGRERIVLAAFHATDKQVGYFDSLKQPPTQDFWLIKYAVEKLLDPLHFELAGQNVVDSTINENLSPWLSTFHICRIAEQICFNGRTQLLKPFNMLDEVERIKKILALVTAPNWNGEWLPTIGDNRVENVIHDVIMGAGSIGTQDINDENASCAAATTVCGGENVQDGYIQQQRRSSNAENIIREIPIETWKQKLEIVQGSMDIYEQKYPVLSEMLKVYLNFTKLRFDHYKRNENTPTVKEKFNFNDCIQMNHFDAVHGLTMFNEFPYFCDLPETDKSELIHRFREPFLMFERLYDTLNTVGSILDDKYIMLQNGDCFKFETLHRSTMPINLQNVFNIIFSSWEKILPIVRKINPDIIEAVYIFCCLLWNSDYLKTPLTPEGEELIRRGRLIIHQEMREFYEYDESQWERIYALRHVMIVTENCVSEYKKRAHMDTP